MLYVSYDFSNNKTRTKFSKFLNKFGIKKQYSVYMIKNSTRALDNILVEIEKVYKNKFEKADSVIIIPISPVDEKKIIKYGYSANDDEDVLLFE